MPLRDFVIRLVAVLLAVVLATCLARIGWDRRDAQIDARIEEAVRRGVLRALQARPCECDREGKE